MNQPILDRHSLTRQIEALAARSFLKKPRELLENGISLVKPPENISTVECSEQYRYISVPKGNGKQLWSRSLTPYNVGPMDALDNPKVQEVVMPKPARSGGTVVFENYAFKLMRFGPMVDIGWYLKSDSEVQAYADGGFASLFDLHSEVKEKIGKSRTDNRTDHKVISGRKFDLLPANPTKMTNRQWGFMVGDEIDTYQPRICASFLQQARIRGRALGSNRKVGMASHPDRGWSTGIASAWITTSRGIYVMPCAECGHWASPYPTKFWKDVPRYRLFYQKAEAGTEHDVRVELAKETACMACPHCSYPLDDEQRHAMVDLGQWMHRGQTLDAQLGICGEAEENESMGFWVHGLMSKMVTNAELARDLEEALITYETTRKILQLREVVAKVFGEVFEGTGKSSNMDGEALHKRRETASKRGEGFEIGTVPDSVKFLTQSIDVGHSKFDIGLWGWDEESRSWMIDRVTIKQRVWPDGIARDIRPAERLEDWMVLAPYIDRKLPLASNPEQGIPIAITCIDTGDGNVTWKAYEFIRRMDDRRWGDFRAVKAIKGATSAKAPEVPPSGTPIAKDQDGKEVKPVIRMFSLGVHKLKEQAVERIGVDDDGPGQCRFADGISRRHMDEFFGERLIGGEWDRSGDNESLDLFAYAEAGRVMMMPDRKDIRWDVPGKRPIWARPVPLYSEGGDPDRPAPIKKAPKNDMLSRFAALNKR